MTDITPRATGTDRTGRDTPIRFEFALLNNVSMLSVISAIEPLRVANRMAGYECYCWDIVSEDGAEVHASNGLKFASSGRIGEGLVPDYTFVCAGLSLEAIQPTRLSAFLNRRAAAGVYLGAISMGSIFLARAGLLRNSRCTIHWEGLPAFKEEFPDIHVSHAIYEVDNGIMTCAGGMSSFDMIMCIIARDHDASLVTSIINQLQLDRVRSEVTLQSSGSMKLPDTAPKRLRHAVILLDENMEYPLSPTDLAETVGASRRTLERMFLKYTGMTPSKFSKVQRLERSKDLLQHSGLSILDIALATGFRSGAYFSYCFSEYFGVPPSQIRR
ncbi:MULTISPECIES: GlxA family transcriptional regulator [Pacificibacter]|uniref:GlxA family transcriptional regulator n=1 Tax=Pacificibacter TaxID=1042323 RepID=UPI001C0A1130|nr:MULTISPECIES: GlxA family transcriptional regulator [Pacificibacter]MBU2937185.1 GlxA family transcriptional regulator [Pacificibacter marinus]MDO6616996.1 GlxA family transcriptional regulator [Pacificibacter sp. 1_MG-2023]